MKARRGNTPEHAFGYGFGGVFPDAINTKSDRSDIHFRFWRFSIRSSTTDGSASVDVSPSSP